MREPCFCGVMPGERVPFDYVGNCEDKDGMAWTRLVNSYPATGVGLVSTDVRNCSATMGFDIELGVLRTGPLMTEDGEPPTDAAQLQAVLQQTEDMLSMYRAISCCDALAERDYIVGQYRPFGPQGFALGGTMMVMVTL